MKLSKYNVEKIVTMTKFNSDKKTVPKSDATLSEIQDYIAIVSHQLRSPLANIRFVHQLLLENEANNLTADQLQLLAKAEQRAKRMFELTQELIEASKNFNDTSVTNQTELIEPLLDEIIDQNSVMAEHKQIKLIHEYDANAKPITFNREKLSDAIFNLLDNAISYTPNEGTITVKTQYNDVTLSIIISDTGIGVPEADVSKLFEKFSRFDNRGGAHTDGSGLGLYVAQKIIQAHHGKIEYKANSPKGSKFIILLPITNNN